MKNYQNEIDLIEDKLAMMRLEFPKVSPAMQKCYIILAKLKKDKIKELKGKILLDMDRLV